jgi:hypothetical protein
VRLDRPVARNSSAGPGVKRVTTAFHMSPLCAAGIWAQTWSRQRSHPCWGGAGNRAGLIALIANSAHALEILVVITAFLWLTATIWHVLTIGSQP